MADLSEGSVFAGHRIEGVAGRGGMGTVYRATHIALDHLVALKVIAPDLATDDSFRERFKSESRIAVSLRHPNVVPIHHAGEEDGLLFVTMDLVDGPDLRKLLIARGPLDGEAAVAILAQVAAALDVAHSRGLVHRDIKPGNILIEEGAGDHAYLTDFGLTKRIEGASAATALTSTGAFVGTLDYVAPEQIRGDDLDATTDVYALGCVLYEMLAGEAPFAGREEKVAKMYAHLQDEVPALGGANSVFDPVIARALAKQQEERFPSAGDLARAAAAALEGRGVETPERSVGVGPAAPTAAHDTPEEFTQPYDPDATQESDAPATGATRESGAPATAREPAEATRPYESDEVPTAPATPRPTDRSETPPFEGKPTDRSRLPLTLAAIAVVAVIAAAAALTLGGGGGGEGGSPATTTPGGAGGGDGGSGGGAAAAFDPRVAGEIEGGELPVGVAAAGNDVYIADRDGQQVIVGSPGSEEARKAVDVGFPPEDVAILGESVYVTVPDASKVVRYDRGLSAGVDITVGAPGSFPAGITAAEGKVWVAGQDDGTVYAIEPGVDAATPVEGVGATSPFGIAVDGDGVLFVVDREGRLIRFDPATGARKEVAVGPNPKGVALLDGIAWVANTDDGTVSRIDTRTMKPRGAPIEVGGQPRAVDVLDGHVWVSNGDTEANVKATGGEGWVDVFDPADPLNPTQVEVGGSPEGLGVTGGAVWVATGTQQTAVEIDPTP